jgi:gliding motility-associated-like protein
MEIFFKTVGLKSLLSFLLYTISVHFCFSQKQNSYWYLSKSGFATFEGDSFNYQKFFPFELWVWGSSSSIADSNGHLLLYADIKYIYDKNNNIIKTDNSDINDSDIAKKVLITPSIKNPKLLYVIKTIDSTTFYTTVNIETNSILGVSSIFGFQKQSYWSQNIGVGSSNCSGIWLFLNNNSGTIVLNKIDTNKTIQFKKFIHAKNNNYILPMSFSPSGKLLAYTTKQNPKYSEGYDSLFICDFDQARGDVRIKNRLHLVEPTYRTGHTWALEFSPNERFLYLIRNLGDLRIMIKQYNLETGEMSVLYDIGRGPSTGITYLKLAPDGRIYAYIVAPGWDINQSSSLAAIINPNEPAPICFFKDSIILFEREYMGAFPNQVQGYWGRKYDFKITQTCIGDSVLFEAPRMADDDMYRWHFSDGFTSTLSGVKRKIDATQSIHLEYNYCDVYDSTKKFPPQTKPISTLPDTPVLACGDTILNYPFKGENLHYQWSTGDTLSSVLITGSGSYFVEVSNLCYKTSDSLEVQFINTVPSLNLSNSYTGCENSPLLVQNSVLGANYVWSTGATTSGINLKQEGKYYLTISNQCRDTTAYFTFSLLKNSNIKPISDTLLCSQNILPFTPSISQTNFTLNNKPIDKNLLVKNGQNILTATNKCFSVSDTFFVKIINPTSKPFGTDTIICYKPTLVLNGGSLENTYLWNSGNTLPNETISTDGTYLLVRENACYKDTFSISVKFIKPNDIKNIANVFTPNGDGVNETWQPLPEPVDKYELKVFNRWGSEVFSSNNYFQNWDAVGVLDGLYFYSISFTNCQNQQQNVKGYVQVLR